MMSRNSSSRHCFEVFCDPTSNSPEDEKGDRAFQEQATSPSHPLRHLSVSQSQNSWLKHDVSPGGGRELIDQICSSPDPKPFVICKDGKKPRRIGGSRLTRPSLTYNTFEVLNTVSESESESASVAAASNDTPDNAPRVLNVTAEQDSTHPLAVAARRIPPLEEQLRKHREGLFEWILAVKVPSDSNSQATVSSQASGSKETKKVYFGCTLLPDSTRRGDDAPTGDCLVNTYLLLIVPLEESKEVLEVVNPPVGDEDMASLNHSSPGHEAPVDTPHDGPVSKHEPMSPRSTASTKGSDRTLDLSTCRSPAEPVARIEDSFEALDMLEEQLEAFGSVARLGKYIPPEKPSSPKEADTLEAPATHPSVRFTTPQPARTCTTKLSSSSLRQQSASEPRKPALRKVTSMTLNSQKLKVEVKASAQTLSKSSTVKGFANLTPQRTTARSSKLPTVPALVIPDSAKSQPSGEKKEDRLALQRATQPTTASLRRAKSVRLPTRPIFELPGEAISRRKREEHQAQLKAQEEEERKRREFKARPLPSKVASTLTPRETIASRARQTKGSATENLVRTPMLNQRQAATIGPTSRLALLSTVNQLQPRGRGLKDDDSPVRSSRATSTSTSSMAGKRSSISAEDIQMQKQRGHEIYKRDNSWTDSRARERHQRELLAKLAREEAAERSRQKSREWAAKQARKRMTIGSLRDITLP
ncbi:hypothetical protein GGS20DRAFT_541648 [Poronia punctata]|nr:hypothetical protein GGS20DRAFT_541648 [Poronia punctata]